MMNFESVNLEGLEGPQNGVSTQITSTDNGDGFDLFKRMIAVSEDEQWRESKPEKKSHDLDAPRAIVQGSSSFPSLSTSQQGNKTEGSDDISGYGEVSSNMHGPVLGTGGPFTPCQRSELQHQILIYKYIHANVAVPHNLLLALIRVPFNPKGHSGLPYGSYAPNQSGWGGSFHPSCSRHIDPELGRCRMERNGGARGMQFLIKKHCERHLNRDRNRSRKHVDGRTGQAASGATGPTASSPLALINPSSDVSNNLVPVQHLGDDE